MALRAQIVREVRAEIEAKLVADNEHQRRAEAARKSAADAGHQQERDRHFRDMQHLVEAQKQAWARWHRTDTEIDRPGGHRSDAETAATQAAQEAVNHADQALEVTMQLQQDMQQRLDKQHDDGVDGGGEPPRTRAKTEGYRPPMATKKEVLYTESLAMAPWKRPQGGAAENPKKRKVRSPARQPAKGLSNDTKQHDDLDQSPLPRLDEEDGQDINDMHVPILSWCNEDSAPQDLCDADGNVLTACWRTLVPPREGNHRSGHGGRRGRRWHAAGLRPDRRRTGHQWRRTGG